MNIGTIGLTNKGKCRNNGHTASRCPCHMPLAHYYKALEAEQHEAEAAGVTVAQLREQRLEGNEAMLLASHAAEAAHDAVGRAQELHNSRAMLTAAFLANQVRGHGFRASELRAGGFSAGDVLRFGYTVKQCHACLLYTSPSPRDS